MFLCMVVSEPQEGQSGGETGPWNAGWRCSFAAASNCKKSCKDSLSGAINFHSSLFGENFDSGIFNNHASTYFVSPTKELGKHIYDNLVIPGVDSLCYHHPSKPLQVIHSARANAAHDHGLNPDRLLVGKWMFDSFEGAKMNHYEFSF